ncbi:MAG TPA: DUF1990 domain-containing protein [Micromonosporaceae bacterium]|nr:DUF1990 domain-containing protein [Micromonosporaceae bacterium]
MSELTYPEVGATRADELPAGYHQLRHRIRLRPQDFFAAGEAVLTYRMHRAAGVDIKASADRAAPGVLVVSRIGLGPMRLAAPCEVVWAVDDERRAGFAYGTLPGHPEQGEEAFLVERGDDGQVWFTVRAFSRPARWYAHLAGPAAVAFQHAYARWLGLTLRRLVRAG